MDVAPQYAWTLGMNANCKTLVSLTLASSDVPVMIGLYLSMPESWTSDVVRMSRARLLKWCERLAANLPGDMSSKKVAVQSRQSGSVSRLAIATHLH